jgi:hypothetical protein
LEKGEIKYYWGVPRALCFRSGRKREALLLVEFFVVVLVARKSKLARRNKYFSQRIQSTSPCCRPQVGNRQRTFSVIKVKAITWLLWKKSSFLSALVFFFITFSFAILRHYLQKTQSIEKRKRKMENLFISVSPIHHDIAPSRKSLNIHLILI